MWTSRPGDYSFVSFSMPGVLPSPFFITQQNASSLPHFMQTCLTTSLACLPVPSVTIFDWQPGQAWLAMVLSSAFAPAFAGFSTTVTQVSLHLGHDMTIVSPGLTDWASSTVLIGLSWINFVAPFSCARAAAGSDAKHATARTATQRRRLV